MTQALTIVNSMKSNSMWNLIIHLLLIANGNQGEGRFENDLPDWNIIYLTDLEDGDFFAGLCQSFSKKQRGFHQEYGDYIVDVDVESHDKAEEGTYMPPQDCCYINENGCPWEAYEDEWE